MKRAHSIVVVVVSLVACESAAGWPGQLLLVALVCDCVRVCAPR
jgi:hypothetical protein